MKWDLSIIIFRYVPQKGDANVFDRQLALNIQESGKVFFSTTTLDKVFYLRIAILSFRTHLEEVDELLQVLKDHTQELLS